jgi:hypothetical protein
LLSTFYFLWLRGLANRISAFLCSLGPIKAFVAIVGLHFAAILGPLILVSILEPIGQKFAVPDIALFIFGVCIMLLWLGLLLPLLFMVWDLPVYGKHLENAKHERAIARMSKRFKR